MPNTELTKIIETFAKSGWDLIDAPAQNWLAADGSSDTTETLVTAIEHADIQCGGCGCEFDPLYKRALELLETA